MARDFSGFNEFHSSARAAGETGLAVFLFAGIFQASRKLGLHQLATALPARAALTTASKSHLELRVGEDFGVVWVIP